MNRPTILIVDDDQNILKSIKRSLVDENYNILTAANGPEGLDMLAQHKVSLVISDQKMPGMSGLEFLQKVKIDYPNILTLMLTAHADVDTTIKAINDAGVYKFILKPWVPAELRMTIRRAVETRQLILEKTSLQQEVKNRDAILRDLERKHPGITRVERDEDGRVLSL